MQGTAWVCSRGDTNQDGLCQIKYQLCTTSGLRAGWEQSCHWTAAVFYHHGWSSSAKTLLSLFCCVLLLCFSADLCVSGKGSEGWWGWRELLEGTALSASQ